MIQIIENLFSTGFELYLLQDFFHGFCDYRQKWDNAGLRLWLMGILIILSAAVIMAGRSNIITLPVGIIVQLFFVCMVFDADFKEKVFFWFFLWTLMFAVEFLFTIFLKLRYQEFAAKMFDTESEFGMAVSLLAVKTATYIIYLLVKRKIKFVRHYMDGQTFFLHILLPVSTLGILLASVYISDDIYKMTAGNMVLLFFSALAFFADILLYYMYQRYARMAEQIRYQENLELRFHALQESYKNLDEESNRYREIIHNIKHYMLLIGNYAKEEENGGIIRVLEGLETEINESKYRVCDNKLFNYILETWKRKAEKAGCSFGIVSDPDFSLPEMAEMDMFVLFGNLFDNAMEGVQGARNGGDIRVELLMRRQGTIAVIKIKNPYDGERFMESGAFPTTKKDQKMHGIGLKSVKKIVDKYGGLFQMETENNHFLVTLIFYTDL